MAGQDPLPSAEELNSRLVRHAEQLREALALREYDRTDMPLEHDEDLHSVAYRLLTTIDLTGARQEADASQDGAPASQAQLRR